MTRARIGLTVVLVLILLIALVVILNWSELVAGFQNGMKAGGGY